MEKKRKTISKKINLGRKSLVGFITIFLIISIMTTAIGLSPRNKLIKIEEIEEKPIENEPPTSLTYSFTFQEPKLQNIWLYETAFTKLDMPSCMEIGRGLGAPNMPVKFVKLLLPPGSRVVNVKVDGEFLEIEEAVLTLEEKPVVPHQNPFPIGEEPSSDIDFDDEIYNSYDIYPSEVFKNQGVGYSRGYEILTIALNPVQYIPVDNRLFYYPEMTVNIDMENTGEFNQFYRGNEDDAQWVQKLVFNPEITSHYTSGFKGPSFDYPGGICDPSEDYDYVLITTTQNGLDDWATTPSRPYNWTSLMDKHTFDDGLSCTLVTVQEIDATTDYHSTDPLFNDQQAHIREFCKDAYQDWGTDYVLIGADAEWIPARLMDYDYESNVDADIYWSNLNNNFNADHDNDWGEELDLGFDLYSELFIGRITCDLPQDVSNWMKKSFYYADSVEKDYLDNAGFYGGDTTWQCQGDDFVDYSAIKGTDNWLGPTPGYHGVYPSWLGFQYGFETWNALNPGMEFNLSVKWTAEPPNPGGWQGGTESAAIAGLKNAISNDQVTLLSGIAHANEDMSLDVGSSSWEQDYHNTKPFFLTDYGCHCGDMDAADDGILHSMLFHSDTELAFAVVYHTGYGWGSSYDTNSSSALQQKLFWDYMFDTLNHSGSPMNWQLGRAHAFSKDEMAPTIDWTYTGAPGSWRGTIESCLLFGDPAQRIKAPIRPDHDIAVASLDVPTNIAYGTSVDVEATIVNSGKNNETNINVDFTVDGIIQDSTMITTLDSGQFEQVSFPWNPDLGTFVIGIEASTVPDENITTNNVKYKTVYVEIYTDAGIISINAPADVIPPGDTDIDVTIENLGSLEETIPVNCSIWESGGEYFSDFEYDDGGWVATADWNPVGDWEWTDSYDYNQYTGSYHPPPNAYSGDGLWATVPHGDYTNAGGSSYLSQTFDFTGFTDTQLSFWNWCEIFYSFDTAELYVNGAMVWEWTTDAAPTAWTYETVDLSAWDGQDNVEIKFALYATTVVERAGWYIDDFRIGTLVPFDAGDLVYSEVTTVTIPPFSSANLLFPVQWDAATGEYIMKVRTMLGGDQESGNDLQSKRVAVIAAADVGAISINYPTDVKTPGYYTVDATIENFGSVDQTTPVNCKIYDDTSTVVYNSDAIIFVPSMETRNVEFLPAWYVAIDGTYLIQVTTNLPGDEYNGNDATEINLTITSELLVTNLEHKWNIISLPFDKTIDKTQFFVYYDGNYYTWSEATTSNNPTGGPIIDSFIFGWDRIGQNYLSSDVIQPGYGYWMYAYYDCELWAGGLSDIIIDNYITSLLYNWNIIGISFDQPVDTTSLIVKYNGVDYTWDEATTNNNPTGGPLIDSFIFGWYGDSQNYLFADTLMPGYGYWMYTYYDCELYKS